MNRSLSLSELDKQDRQNNLNSESGQNTPKVASIVASAAASDQDSDEEG